MPVFHRETVAGEVPNTFATSTALIPRFFSVSSFRTMTLLTAAASVYPRLGAAGIDTAYEIVGETIVELITCVYNMKFSRYSKLKMSSSSGRCMPCSWYSSQMSAHGRPYMSGTLYSITPPGDTGVARPSRGKIVGTHSMNW